MNIVTLDFCSLLNFLAMLIQTPSSPVAGGSSAGRKTSRRIILVCHGTLQGDIEV